MNHEDWSLYKRVLDTIADSKRTHRIVSQAKPSEACFLASAILTLFEQGPKDYFQHVFGRSEAPPIDRGYSAMPEVWRKFIRHKAGRFDCVAADLLRWLLIAHRIFQKNHSYMVRNGNTKRGFKTTLPYIETYLGYSVPQLREAFKRLAALDLLSYTQDRLKDAPCYLIKLNTSRIAEITFASPDEDEGALEDDVAETEDKQTLESRERLEPKATAHHPAARSAMPEHDNRKDVNLPPDSPASLQESGGSNEKSVVSNSGHPRKVEAGKSAEPDSRTHYSALGPRLQGNRARVGKPPEPDSSSASKMADSTGWNSEDDAPVQGERRMNGAFWA
jgi:hypothetical protein